MAVIIFVLFAQVFQARFQTRLFSLILEHLPINCVLLIALKTQQVSLLSVTLRELAFFQINRKTLDGSHDSQIFQLAFREIPCRRAKYTSMDMYDKNRSSSSCRRSIHLMHEMHCTCRYDACTADAFVFATNSALLMRTKGRRTDPKLHGYREIVVCHRPCFLPIF